MHLAGIWCPHGPSLARLSLLPVVAGDSVKSSTQTKWKDVHEQSREKGEGKWKEGGKGGWANQEK
jgi:hypothetical protein